MAQYTNFQPMRQWVRQELVTPPSKQSKRPCKTGTHFYFLHSSSLISLCQLCENDCIAILDKNEINILKGEAIIIKGHRKKTYGLWDIPISNETSRSYNHHKRQDEDWTNTISSWMLFQPQPKNFRKAIENGNFLIWLGLNNQQLLKHLPSIIATI